MKPTHDSDSTQMYDSLLSNHNLKVWDKITFLIDGKSYTGTVLPRYDSENIKEGIISLKLSTGYNIGIKITRIEDIQKIGKETQQLQTLDNIPNQEKELPLVIILGGGGTISARLDYGTGAVIPTISAEFLLKSYPALYQIARIKTYAIFEKLSENLSIQDWQTIADKIFSMFEKYKPQGIVVTHGTDTMSYGAAFLALALKYLPGPVIITGSQRSADRPSSDASLNLMNAVFTAANSKVNEVMILMHKESSDTAAYLHGASTVKKTHTSRRNAFQSVNSPPQAQVNYLRKSITWFETCRDLKKNEGKFTVDTGFNEQVTLVWVHPALSEQSFKKTIADNKGIVLMGTGLGHIPEKLHKIIQHGRNNGKEFVMISQCLSGFTNMHVYESGRRLLKLGVINGKNMTPAMALAKLSYALGHYTSHENIKSYLVTEQINEFSGYRELYRVHT